ncbi:DUF4893 domain-containing protein [Sphingomonas sp. HT-1]|jgi:hypothetical protein|uniref:DUF4893 domain-containing protein n=1 Tax=unclassified Sphingomonas TaxID=196159 RepID=UPI000304FAA6|nr:MULTISPECIES: DUF4893 domain-containing protein [unclassified Sphingomonas]KTF68868.1 hypothetical protein ATB93_11865 [Sphingomonas sp. WG]
MIVRSLVAAAALAAMLGGCGVYREATTSQIDTSGTWRQVATDVDRERLRKWRDAWDEALPLARAANAAAIDADPLLFDPDRALGEAMPPVGAYRCRTYKLGGDGPAVSPLTIGQWQPCALTQEGPVRHFRVSGGVQRAEGDIFPETTARVIFIGTLEIGDESAPLRYGIDNARDLLGYGEQIETRRWRFVVPYPRFESKLDVVEMVPAGV